MPKRPGRWPFMRPAFPSRDQRAAGEAQEDVLQRAAPDQDAPGRDASAPELGDGPVTVAGREEDAVADALDAVGHAVELAVGAPLGTLGQPQLDDLAAGVALDQLLGGPLGDDLRVVHD